MWKYLSDCVSVYNKCYISQFFLTLPRTWDLTCETFTSFCPNDIHHQPPSLTPYSYSFTLSASVMNRITTDRCALWQHTASICSKRMHRKLVNMSRKRNRKNVIRDFSHSSFLRILFGLSISLLILLLSNAPHVLYGLRGPPSWAWQKCNRLLNLGRPWGGYEVPMM